MPLTTEPTRFGIDRLCSHPENFPELRHQRLALLANPASLTQDFRHAMDALSQIEGFNLCAAFGPQHGLRGDKQDNMVETADEFDSRLKIPVFSLYGDVRRPTATMLEHFDVLLIDLQDLGCRIYTFITTLRYVLEACSAAGKSVWVLDRPNPIGRMIEGFSLKPDWESFVGAGPMPMRHGLTLGELGRWFIDQLRLDLDYRVITMEGWDPLTAPGFGWPLASRCWINPSPNAPNLWMARAYPGSVMMEGTTLSEGRGTTRPLEILGAPDLDPNRLLNAMTSLQPEWLKGCRLRPLWFEPTFHKHAGHRCGGFQIHTEPPCYEPERFKPWRLMALAFKGIRQLHADYPLWRDFPYEYEYSRLAIDLINGGPALRLWVDDAQASPRDLEDAVAADEAQWAEEREPYLLYRPDIGQ